MLKTLTISTLLFVGSPVFAAASYNQVAEVFPPDPESGQFFGRAVAMDDNVAVVGAPFSFSPLTSRPPFDGAAYVFVKSNGAWVLQQKLVASDGNAQTTGAGNQFGSAVALGGNSIVVGAPSRKSDGKTGAVYVFTRSDTNTGWTEQAIITSSTPRPFGLSVALRGGTLVAGGLEDRLSAGGTSDAGLAFVFTRNGDDWVQQANLMSADVPPNNSRYGISVDIRGNTVVVGTQDLRAPFGGLPGAVYIFSRQGNAWQEDTKLSSANNSQTFGQSVSLSGDILVAGDPSSSTVSVYEHNGQDWQPLQTIAGSSGTEFGYSVAQRESSLLIGARSAGGPGFGAAYLYGFDEATWSWMLIQTLSPADGQQGDNYGVAVGLSSSAAIIGAPRHFHAPNPQSGGAYIYEP